MHIFNVIYNYAFNSHLCSNICLVMMIMIFWFLLLFITKSNNEKLILGMAKIRTENSFSSFMFLLGLCYFCVFNIHKSGCCWGAENIQ